MPKLKVIWSDESLQALDTIIDYIFEEWGIQPIMDLQYEIDRLIHLIKENKNLCPKSKTLNVRKCVLSEQTSMVYKIERSHLEIITFVDNRSRHNY